MEGEKDFDSILDQALNEPEDEGIDRPPDDNDPDDNAAGEGDDNDEGEKPEAKKDETAKKWKLKNKDEEQEVDEKTLLELAHKGFDYTKKTSEVAAQRREMEVQALQQQQAAMQEKQSHYQELQKYDHAITVELEKLRNLDTRGMDAGQIAEVNHSWNKLRDAKAELEAAKGKIEGEYQQLQQQQAAFQQQEIARLAEEGKLYVNKNIPGFDSAKLTKYALDFGFDNDALSKIYDGRVIHVLHKAMLWDELQKSKPEINKRVKDLPNVIKPGVSQDAGEGHSDRMKKLRKQVRGSNSASQTKAFESLLG